MTLKLAAELAAIVCRESGTSIRPPIDLVALAEFLGIASIELRPLEEDGRIEVVRGGPRIYINSRTSRERQRFTLAHEIGHHLLNDPEQELISYRSRPLGYDDTERFCDQFAASLLLPHSWIAEEFGDSTQCVRSIRQIAELAHVSFSAAFVRAHEILGWRVTMMRLRPRRDKWFVTELHKRPPALFKWPKPPAEANRQLSDWARGRSEFLDASLELRAGGRSCWFTGEVSAHNTSVVLLGTIDWARPVAALKAADVDQLRLF